ncbi:uncharacterized protein N7459_009393 [Penicillium hispanicum]|uniref:uncharacterized protein n=1 Tax=Penicillium hispanicum TaxID=1080232 RepID=UPI002540F1AE|nr:uncharacterized protein N7459_009393 [Penicillium hispanicum]KAJ5569963.1 hypothetical protein N7459_009393 [Penicillium hispanicum]
MSLTQGEASAGPGGAAALGSQLLAQFQTSTVQRSTPSNMSDIEKDGRQSPAPEAAPIESSSTLEIIVPNVDNPSDYEYLPGHFAVRRILHLESDDPKKPIYSVRLESGESLTMTYDRLMQLDKASEALDQFNPDSDSDDELVSMSEKSHSRRLTYGGDAAVSEDSDIDFPAAQNTRRRRAHAPGQYSAYFQIEDSDDDGGVDASESSSDELNARSYTTNRLRRGVRDRTRITSGDHSASTTAKSTRVSSRQRKSIRSNLQERLEDDLSEVDSATSRDPRYAGAREVFRELSRDDEFRERHFACCSACNYFEDDPDKGPLVFCQGCTSSYHKACLGPRSSREHLVTKIGEDDFILQCRRCLGIAHEKHDVSPHLGHCASCKEEGSMSQPLRERLTSKEEQQQRIANDGSDPITPVDMALVNNVENVLFRCTSCQRAFHVHHLRPITGEDPSQIFSDYSIHWQCGDCSDAVGEIEELVAWRPIGSRPKGPGIPHAELIPETDKEYLIKWKRKSYFRVTWMRGDWVWGVSNHAMRRAFFNSPKSRKPIFTIKEAVPEENLRVDIVFDVNYSRDVSTAEDEAKPEMVQEAYVKYKGLNYEDSVWESPPEPTDTARWEDFQAAFADWVYRDTIQPPNRSKLKDHLGTVRQLNFENSLVLGSQPKMISGGELMGYQMEGVNWLYYMFFKQQNAILADDMGLGKTIQVITLFATLIERHQCWPFLVVAPNSTVPNWRREIKTWAPEIRVVTYFGSAFSRRMAKDYEMFPEGGKDLRCHVVIASYESMVEEARQVLAKIPWAGLVVDEGQRLKNDKSQLYERLCRMKFDFKVLLTGTPLQNNIRELFNLIQFLDPAKDANQLEMQYGELTKENIRDLHEMIRPFFLRRTKAEVLPFLPPMVQIIVPVSMSVVQKKLYKSILGKNPELIRAICKRQAGQLKKSERHNLNNILVQLRKCLCHPFIYNKDIEEQAHDPALAHKHLVEASGKLQLLDLMLPKLRERGHRVLIFSQFLENLDIVEDFLEGLALPYCRLDGKLTARQKQHQIDRFNAPDSPLFAFLLSTRSGGVGINLASADTVIIMDPDFNPKQDMQALSRAHRIGQTNTVLVFHLTTRSSVEEKIMQKGKKKLALDHVLIERMEAGEDEGDLESILRHGAEALFGDDEASHVHYDSESIDKLLDRSQAEKAEQTSHDTPASTEQPQFSFARVWQNERGTLEEVAETEDTSMDATVWEKILRDRERDAIEEAHRKAEGLGRGKRKRATVNYQTVEELNDFDGGPSPMKLRKGSDRDVEFRPNAVAEDLDSESSEPAPADMEIRESPAKTKTRLFERVQVPSLPPMGNDGTMDIHPSCRACLQIHPRGSCPLKLAGVENCPLCGLAHFGKQRSCPHLHSLVQVRRMLDALKESREPPELVDAARKYLKGVIGSTLQNIRRKTEQAAQEAAMNTRQAPTASISPGMLQNPASQSPVATATTTSQPPAPSSDHRSEPTFVDLT